MAHDPDSDPEWFLTEGNRLRSGRRLLVVLAGLVPFLLIFAGSVPAQIPAPEPDIDVQATVTPHNEPIVPHTGKGIVNIQVAVTCEPPGIQDEALTIDHRLEADSDHIRLTPAEYTNHIEFETGDCLIAPSVKEYDFNVTVAFHKKAPAFQETTVRLFTDFMGTKTMSAEWGETPGFKGESILIEEIHQESSNNRTSYKIQLKSDANADLEIHADLEMPPEHGHVLHPERFLLPYKADPDGDGETITIDYGADENRRDLFQIRFTATAVETGESLPSSALFTGNPEPLGDLQESPGPSALIIVLVVALTASLIQKQASRKKRR